MKEKLHEIIENPQGKIICFDIDQTISTGAIWVSTDDMGEPIKSKFELARNIIRKGGIVSVYTARSIYTATETLIWLEQHGFPYSMISFGKKPFCDVMIDDKCLNAEEV